jgi:hypothetical protein
VKEEIVGRIEATKKAMMDFPAELFFTSHRVAVAVLLSGGGMFGSAFSDTFSGGFTRFSDLAKKKREEYEKLSVDDILAADKKNYAIPYEEILKVEMKKPGTFSGIKMKISTGTKKHEFVFKKKKVLFDELVNLVRPLVGEKLSVG